MAGELVPIEGLEEVQRMLADAPRVIVGSAFARALKAGATVIEEALAARTPVREIRSGGDVDEPALIENLRVDIALDADLRGGSAEIGFGKAGYIANFIEYGHRMVSHEGKELGRVQPHPFMRPAAELSADAAIEAFGNTLVETLRGTLLD